MISLLIGIILGVIYGKKEVIVDDIHADEEFSGFIVKYNGDEIVSDKWYEAQGVLFII